MRPTCSPASALKPSLKKSSQATSFAIKVPHFNMSAEPADASRWILVTAVRTLALIDSSTSGLRTWRILARRDFGGLREALDRVWRTYRQHRPPRRGHLHVPVHFGEVGFRVMDDAGGGKVSNADLVRADAHHWTYDGQWRVRRPGS